jgi:hypothetical protein
MINNIKSQMHRKPTFDKIIYKALLPFNEVKYPDREATILRRSHKLTKYDEVQFLGLQRDTEAIQKSQIQQANTLAAASPKAPIMPAPGTTGVAPPIMPAPGTTGVANITTPITPTPEVAGIPRKLKKTQASDIFVNPVDYAIQQEIIKREIDERKKEEKLNKIFIAEKSKKALRGLADSVKQGKFQEILDNVRKDIKDKQEKEIAEEENKLLKMKIEEQSPTTKVMSISSPRIPKKPRGRSASRSKESSAPAASSGEPPEEPRKDEVKASTGEQTEEEKLRKPRRTKEQIESDKTQVNLKLPESTRYDKLNSNIMRLIGLVGGLNDDQITKYTNQEKYNSVTTNKQVTQANMLMENFKIYQQLVNKFTNK